MNTKSPARLIILWIFVLVSLSSCIYADPNGVSLNQPLDKIHSPGEIKSDFEQLSQVILKRQPMLFADQEEIQRLIDEIGADMNHSMTELEFFRLINPLVTALNCGHTNLNVSKDLEDYLRNEARFLPLEVKMADNDLYVIGDVSTKGAYGILPGSRIVEINGMPAEEIVEKLVSSVSRDGQNRTKGYYTVNKWFNCLYYLFIDNSDNLVLTLEPADKAPLLQINVKAEHVDRFAMTPVSIYYPDSDQLWSMDIRNAEKNRESYALLKVSSFIISDKSSFKRFVDHFFEIVTDREIGNVILDLRGNWGGDPGLGAYLFSYLIQTPQPYLAENNPFYYFRLKKPVQPAENGFKGNLQILIDGASFSTTGHLVSLLKSHAIGTFVGQESGGTYVCTAALLTLNMKHTGLRLLYSTNPFYAAAEGLPAGRGIIPDYEVTPSLEDYLQNKDSVKETALTLF